MPAWTLHCANAFKVCFNSMTAICKELIIFRFVMFKTDRFERQLHTIYSFHLMTHYN